MSNVSTRHAIVPFVASKSQALSGQRLCKVGFKLTEKMKAEGKKALPSVCASIPPVDTAAVQMFADELLPFVVRMIESAQDGILRSLYESSGGTLTDVTDEELSIPACIAYMSAEAAGTRLSTESISAWFDSALADNLTVVIADKLGFDLSTDEQTNTVQKHVRLHRDVLCVLAGKNVILSPKQETGIRNMLRLAGDESDTMYEKISRKFTEVTAKADADLIDIG